MELVDFHCHLDLYPDHPAAIAECEQKGVHTLTVTTTPKAWPRNRELTRSTRYVHAALGIHPQLVAERAHELGLWEEYLPQTHYVGEVGLDAGPRFYRSIEMQKQVFTRVLTCCAAAGGKVLSVHSVRAGSTVLDLVEEHFPADRGCVILHWFTGNKSEARRAVELGCYFSINAEMMRNQRHIEMVKALPLNRVLTETDGPFCHHAGRPARPVDVSVVVDMLANARAMSSVEVAAAIVANMRFIEQFGDGDRRHM